MHCRSGEIMMLYVFLLFLDVYFGNCSEDSWSGKWFPHKPSSSAEQNNGHVSSSVHNIPMGIADECDDGKNNLKEDFNPADVSDSLRYICLENRTLFSHNYSTQPILKENIVPLYYVPLHKCVNESIEYEERLPTFGTHRPLWAKYGEYKFLPIQRWLHNLEHGAVVMLYHPCANYDQIEKLKMLTVNCLYRHVITPSKRLLPERPLALVTWGKSLEMSIVDSSIVINFIKKSALKGPEKTSRDGQYDELIVKSANVVSSEEDSVLCPNYV